MEDLIGRIQRSDVERTLGSFVCGWGCSKPSKNSDEMMPKVERPMTRRAHEAANLHLAALLVARSALAREESRGAHYRIDYPDHDDKKFLKHSIVRGDKIVFVA